MKRMLLLTLLIVCLCVVLVACGQKDPPPAVCIHTYDDGVVTQEPTCITKGVKTYSCTKCEESYTEDIKTIDHTFNDEDSVVTKPATCKEFGETTIICATEGCTATKKGALQKLDHVADETQYGSDDNNHWYPCQFCGNKLSQAVHTWDEGEVKTAATCIATGVITKTCTVCDKERDFDIEKTKHTWDDGDVSKAASTTTCEAGLATYTCTTTGCDATKTAAVPSKIQHTLSNTVVTVDGKSQMKFSCSVCADEWTSETCLLWDGTGAGALEGIDWMLGTGFGGSANPAVKDEYYVISRSADPSGASAQAQFWYTKARISGASEADGTLAFFTLSLKAPEAGLFENGWNIQLVDDKATTDRWSPAFCVRDFLSCDAEGVMQGGADIEGNRVQLGTLTSAEWMKIVVAIEFEEGSFYWSYFVNGEFCGTAVVENTIATKKINSYYFTGGTTTAGTGLLLDDLGFVYANNDEFLPVNRHLEHNWVAGDTFAPSTDTCAYGYTEYTCPDCGAVKKDDFVQSTVAHNYDPTLTTYTKNPVAEDAANEVEAEDGEWTLVCKDCDWHEHKTGSFDEHDHAYNAADGVTSEDGTKVTHTCTVPGCEHEEEFDVEVEDAPAA